MKSYAVVGASANAEKYGFRVFKHLRDMGFEVFAVNQKGGTLLGERVYRSIGELPKVPDVVVTVVPPMATEQIVEECLRIGVKKVWMQPGSESQRAIGFCRKNGIDVVFNACIMVERKKER